MTTPISPVGILTLEQVQELLAAQELCSKPSMKPSRLKPGGTDTDDARLAGIAQRAVDQMGGNFLLGRIGTFTRSGHRSQSSAANMKPSIRIEARCKNGHETYMYPKDCVGLEYLSVVDNVVARLRYSTA